jgi:hypothetical protein
VPVDQLSLLLLMLLLHPVHPMMVASVANLNCRAVLLLMLYLLLMC